VENLEYVTRGDNIRHAYRNGIVSVKGEEKINSKLTDEDVKEIRRSNLSSRSLGEAFGISHSTVLAIRRRRKWSHVT
jgi:hypothetical protein